LNAAPEGGSGLSELALRTLSAIVLIVIALAATWTGGLVFAALCAVVAILLLAEYLQIASSALPAGMRPAAFAALAAALAAWVGFGAGAALAVLAAAFALLAGYELMKSRRMWGAAGLVYALLPCLALTLLRGDDSVGLHAILVIFACVWGTDALAYFAGRAIGGPRLAPRISPKKTWAGFLGGITGAVAAALPVLYFSGYRPGAGAVVLAILLSVVSQLGDLGESWLKRCFGVKDSGTLIPGHGGVLDRVDGLILVAIVAWIAGGLRAGDLLMPANASQALFTAFVLP